MEKFCNAGTLKTSCSLIVSLLRSDGFIQPPSQPDSWNTEPQSLPIPVDCRIRSMAPLPDSRSSQIVQGTPSIIVLGFYSGNKKKKAERSSFSVKQFHVFGKKVKYVHLHDALLRLRLSWWCFQLRALITFPFSILVGQFSRLYHKAMIWNPEKLILARIKQHFLNTQLCIKTWKSTKCKSTQGWNTCILGNRD